jgi:hypothetical protein
MKREMKYKIQSIAIIIAVSSLFMGVSAQGRALGVSSSPVPSSTFLSTIPSIFPSTVSFSSFIPIFSGEYLPSSSYLVHVRSFSPSGSFEFEEKSVLEAGGTEGGGNPQKMPAEEGIYIMVLLVSCYLLRLRLKDNISLAHLKTKV